MSVLRMALIRIVRSARFSAGVICGRETGKGGALNKEKKKVSGIADHSTTQHITSKHRHMQYMKSSSNNEKKREHYLFKEIAFGSFEDGVESGDVMVFEH
jgi:hypothetical protein